MTKDGNKEREKFNLLKLGKLVLMLSYMIGGGYVVYAFIYFLICKNTIKIFNLTSNSYYQSVAIPILIVLVLSVIIVSGFFVKNNKGVKRVLMCISGVITLLTGLCMVSAVLLWMVFKAFSFTNFNIVLRLIGQFCVVLLPIFVIVCTIIFAFSEKRLSYNGKLYLAFFTNIILFPLLVTSMSHPFMAICLGIFAVVLTIIILKTGLSTRCPNCKKWFAYHRIDSEVIEQKDTTVKIKQEVKSTRTGETVYVTDAYVPGIQTTYKVKYCCSHCQYIDYGTEVKKKAIG